LNVIDEQIAAIKIISLVVIGLFEVSADQAIIVKYYIKTVFLSL